MASVVLVALFTGRQASAFAVDPTTDFGRAISELGENEWGRLNLTRFDSVWTPRELIPVRPGDLYYRGSPKAVLRAWSSMAWDDNRGDLIFFGGGHANYTGNEVYRWRSSTRAWDRASLPSRIEHVSGATFRAVDGEFNAPIGAHTYDNSEFLPNADRFVSFGGASYDDGRGWYLYQPDGTATKTGPYFWDPSRADANKVGGLDGSGVDPSTPGGQMWENRNNLVPAQGGAYPGDSGTSFINGVTARSYDPTLNEDVLYVADARDLWRYTVTDVNDPSSDRYEHVGRVWDPANGQGAGAFDYVDNLFLRTAGSGGVFSFWDLDAAPDASGLVRNQLIRPLDPSGQFDFANLRNYGMDYDAVRNRFVLWKGDHLLWELRVPPNPQVDDWVLQEILPSSLLAPDPFALEGDTRGILGKWKYIPGLDVFLGVEDSVAGDIWAYKPVGWRPEVVAQWLPGVPAPAPLWSIPSWLLYWVYLGWHRRIRRASRIAV